jgi:hypothetical protein
MFPKFFNFEILSYLKEEELTNVHFTLRPLYPPGESPVYSLSMMLTGPQTHTDDFGEENFPVSCRKLKDNFLVAHHVNSTPTQTETSTYCT